jgi:hypothetical protein
MLVLRVLADVQMPATQIEHPPHRPVLVINRRTRQVEVGPSQSGLRRRGVGEPDPQLGGRARQQGDAIAGDLAAEHRGPEPCEARRVVRIETYGVQPERHQVTVGGS